MKRIIRLLYAIYFINKYEEGVEKLYLTPLNEPNEKQRSLFQIAPFNIICMIHFVPQGFEQFKALEIRCDFSIEDDIRLHKYWDKKKGIKKYNNKRI